MTEFPKRWVACFDILGFQSLSEKEKPEYVLEIYNKALQASINELKLPEKAGIQIGRWHFSDTFVFYSVDDEGPSYTWIQSIAKNFIRGCLSGDPIIPFRGAIACGEFYADHEKNIYFGKAFIEAYKEAEAQNWIGLILTKTAKERIRKYNPSPNPARHQFPVVDVPMKTKYPTTMFTSKHPAYSFHAETIDQTSLIRVLEGIILRVDDKVKIKYQNTIDHIKRIAPRVGKLVPQRVS